MAKDAEHDHTSMAPVTMLNLYRILFEKTDEDHGLKANEIMEELKKRRTPLGRTALLDYIDALDDHLFPYADDSVFEDADEDDSENYDDEKMPKCIKRPSKGFHTGYRLRVRTFTFAEVKFLADAVAASRSVSKKTAEKLIEKLESLVSQEQAKELRRQIWIDGRPRPSDEYVLSNISVIFRAIDGVQDRQKTKDKYRCKIKFDYYEYDADRKLIYAGEYICSPYALAWIDDRYCLIASHPEHGIAAYYADLMGSVETVKKEEKRRGKTGLTEEKADELPEEYTAYKDQIPNGNKASLTRFDLPEYLRTVCFSFGGENDESAELEADRSVAGNIIKKLEDNARIIPAKKKNTVTVTVRVDRSAPEPFFSWLTGFGSKIRIVRPDGLREQYIEYLRGIIDANER